MKNKKLINILCIYCAAVALSGCNTLKYQEPVEGAKAKVRFVATSKEVSVLRSYTDANCSQGEVEWMRLREGPLLNSTPKTLDLPLNNYHKNAFKEVVVPADKEITAMFVGAQTSPAAIYSCGVPFSYRFKDGKSYEVKFNWQTTSCSVTLSEISNDSGTWLLKPLQVFNNQLNETNQGCMQQFKKTRLY